MANTPRTSCPVVLLLTALLVIVAPPLRADPQATTVEVTVDARNTLTITANRETKTIEAAGRDITITGNQNQLTLTGECRTLTVVGNDNVVTVETAASISLTGNHNRLTWTKGPGDGKPSVTDVGNDNNVERRDEP